MLISLLLLLTGLAIVIAGADRLVRGASSLATLLKVPEIVIGLTVVAFGTSMPELVVNLFSSAEGHADIVFGNVIGSNLFNLLLILALTALARPLSVRANTFRREIPLSLLAALLLGLLVNDDLIGFHERDLLSRTDGIILLLLFAAFLLYTHRLSGDEAGEHPVRRYAWGLSLLMVLLGIGALVLGGRLVVSRAVRLAALIGISQKVVGLTIVAAGTSLPELTTSVVAALHKRSDLAIGNVVGSNIFNLLMILGLSSLIRPAAYDTAFNLDLAVLSGATAILLVLLLLPPRMVFSRWKGAIFLALYLAYVVKMAV
jgi:cation:H+ antiporter